MRLLLPRAVVLCLPLLAACDGSRSDETPSDEAQRPNVVLFLADDLGVECVGAYGGESYETPHLDALAAQGVRFANAHAQPSCTASRVKLLTGRDNARNYVRFGILDPDERTFAHLLQEAGYATGAVGKWQLYGPEFLGAFAGTGTTPAAAGFDEWCLRGVTERASIHKAPTYDVNGEIVRGSEDEYPSDVLADWALDFIGRHADEPFLLYYPMVLVHRPFTPPPGSSARGRNFAQMVAYMDGIVGRVLAELEKHHLSERTVVIFTGDNGTAEGVRSRFRGEQRVGGKGLTTDAGTHVPLLVSWPGTAAAGSTCADLIDFSDVLPTLAELCGAALPESLAIDGRSFLPQVRGEPGNARRALACYYNPHPDEDPTLECRWARTIQFKLYGTGELFDVLADPGESRPIPSGAGSAAAEEARALLAESLRLLPEPAKIARPAAESGPREDD